MTDKTTGIALIVAVIFGILVLALANSGWLQGLGVDSVTTEHLDATNQPVADYCVKVDSLDITQFEIDPCVPGSNAAAYAELYVTGGAAPQTFGGAFTKVDQWAVVGDNQDMTASASGDTITAVLDGAYLLLVSASLTGTVNTTFTAQAFLDGVALPGITAQVRADGTEQEVTIAGLVTLAANQALDIRVQASPPSSGLLLKEAVFAVHRLVSAVGGGGGITSLNGLTGSAQTFADIDDTNVTLAIASAGSTHTFTVGWAGILAVSRGGTGSAPAGDDQALVSDSSSAATWRTLPNCGGATTDKLLYTQASNSFSCGVDQGGGGGITNLNGLTGSSQTFADVDDTNVTLAIASAGTTHTFTAGWAGTLAVSRGGTGSAPAGDDQALVSDSSSAATWRTLPNCGGATTDKLLYTQASNLFSCGVDQTGAGDAVNVNGSAATDANFIDGDIDFTLDTGPSPDTIAATVACSNCVALATETTGNDVATITAPAAGITVSGVGAEDATALFALADDLGALEALTLTGTVVRTATNVWGLRVSATAFSVENPTSSENLFGVRFDHAAVITKVVAVLRGSATPSVTWSVRKGTDRSAAGTEVVTGGTTTTSTTTGSVVTTFNSDSIAANSFLWLTTSAQSGTVNEIMVTIFWRPA